MERSEIRNEIEAGLARGDLLVPLKNLQNAWCSTILVSSGLVLVNIIATVA